MSGSAEVPPGDGDGVPANYDASLEDGRSHEAGEFSALGDEELRRRIEELEMRSEVRDPRYRCRCHRYQAALQPSILGMRVC